MSLVTRKPAFCICENKDADQVRGNREADQRLCFRYIASTILYFLNTKFQGFSHLLWAYSPLCVGPGWKPRIQFSRDAAHMSFAMAWSDKTHHKMLNYSFYSLLVLYKADFGQTYPHTCKTSSKSCYKMMLHY